VIQFHYDSLVLPDPRNALRSLGVEGFTPRNAAGNTTPPQLYSHFLGLQLSHESDSAIPKEASKAI
jgi:hypothetical protein